MFIKLYTRLLKITIIISHLNFLNFLFLLNQGLTLVLITQSNNKHFSIF